VNAQVIKFREFELDRDRYELRRNGRAVKLEKMPMELLILLAAKKGNLVTRQEIIECLWGREVFIDSEHGINTVVRKLRQALRDDPEKPRFVETVTGKGYKFVAETVVVEPAVEAIAETIAAPIVDLGRPGPEQVETPVATKTTSGTKEAPKRGRWLLWGGVALAAAAGAVVWYLSRPLPLPKIVEYAQITHDGSRKWLIGTDGSRLYFNSAPTYEPFEIGIAGGDSTRISIGMKAPVLSSVSPDGSTFLLQQWEDDTLWSAGIPGGPLRRLTTFDTPTANWSPDGKEIVYTTPDGAIYLMRSDGTDAHRLASAGGPVDDIAWSPDGGRVRYTKDHALWEISSSGSNLHPLLPGWPAWHCCGRWTADGRYFYFLSGIRSFVGTTAYLSAQVWMIDERRGLVREESQPRQLTSGPMGWCCITPSLNGKTIFAVGQTARGELVRFDTQSHQLRPYMGGISAEFLWFSGDGKAVAYVTYPDGNLWRANRDGSERVQLSGRSTYPSSIRWSPDGTQVLYSDAATLKDSRLLYVIPARGGTPTRITSTDSGPEHDPSWSPDGKRIVFFASRTGDLRIVDLIGHQIRTLPGSSGMFSPRWSADGKSIVAMTNESETLKTFDFATQRWSTLLANKGGMGFPTWSHDGRYVYILYLSDKPGVYRVRATGGAAERVVDLAGFHHTGLVDFWFGLDPTDAPLLLRDAGTEDIYALTLETK
jgi:Tol biopolymer transport system component/DNA-binding winged helix-turn-helix (wHTH) protein